MGSSASITNRNNRKLQRVGNSAYKRRKGELLGRNLPRTDKPVHDQYNYADRTPPVWKRLLVLGTILAMVGVLVYALSTMF